MYYRYSDDMNYRARHVFGENYKESWFFIEKKNGEGKYKTCFHVPVFYSEMRGAKYDYEYDTTNIDRLLNNKSWLDREERRNQQAKRVLLVFWLCICGFVLYGIITKI